MRRYYWFVWFRLWTGCGIFLLALVILEWKEQNKNILPTCNPSEEHQQIEQKLETISIEVRENSVAIKWNLESIDRAVSDINYNCQK